VAWALLAGLQSWGQQELVSANPCEWTFSAQDANASVFIKNFFKMAPYGAMICGFAAEVAL
jgi:hypothetical protein